MNRFMTWPGILVPVFGTGIAACVAALGIETDWGRSLRRDPSIAPMRVAKAADAALLPVFTLPGLDGGLPESAERPLFMPSRRAVPAASPAPRMRPGQFILVGTSRTKEFGDSAMLKEIATNKTVTVKLGAAVQDMTLDSIGPDRVVLKLGDEQEELIMKARPQARPAGAPAPGAPAPAMQAQAPQAPGIFGGPAPTPASAPPSALPPGAQIPPGAPGSPTVFPGAPGSSIANPAAAQTAPAAATPNRAPTPEEILERRRRARALQQQAQ